MKAYLQSSVMREDDAEDNPAGQNDRPTSHIPRRLWIAVPEPKLGRVIWNGTTTS
jgi:hypothetical protein